MEERYYTVVVAVPSLGRAGKEEAVVMEPAAAVVPLLSRTLEVEVEVKDGPEEDQEEEEEEEVKEWPETDVETVVVI